MIIKFSSISIVKSVVAFKFNYCLHVMCVCVCLYVKSLISLTSSTPLARRNVHLLASLPPMQAVSTKYFFLEQFVREERFQIYEAFMHFEKRFSYFTYFLLWIFLFRDQFKNTTPLSGAEGL